MEGGDTMYFSKKTINAERAAIRKYYESKYQRLINKEYNEYIDSQKDEKPTYARDFLKTKTKFLMREKNNLIDDLDRASDKKVEELYHEIFG